MISSEQQNQQQMPSVQQSQSQSQHPMSPAQPLPQMLQLQPQGHMQEQALPLQQVQHPLSSVSVSDIFHFGFER